jgi:glycosyltransferase involved in cell wall biosynthesis
MADIHEHLRVALVAGQLIQGGAEKQLVYAARALHQASIEVRIYSLTRGDFYESALQAMGLQTIWIGRFSNPLLRLAILAEALSRYRPHILQSASFFTNLYPVISGHLWHAMAIGAIRVDTRSEVDANGKWGQWLLHMPPVLLTNSYAGKHNAEALGIKSDKIRVLPNVIDLAEFDEHVSHGVAQPVRIERPTIVAIGRLVPEKRLDKYLKALALARREICTLKGLLIGDGPERARLESLANDLGLLPDGLLFLGRRTDVPALLCQTNMLVLSSDHEGFPNVLLEAMAARLPVITTPAGDAGAVVQDGVTGYVVPFDDVEGMAERIIRLAKSPALCFQLGSAGRQRVEQLYSFDGMAEHLLSIYRSIAERHSYRHVLTILSS